MGSVVVPESVNHCLKEGSEIHLERSRHTCNRLEGRIAASTLDPAQVRPVQTRPKCELLLRNTKVLAVQPNRVSELAEQIHMNTLAGCGIKVHGL